MAKCKSCEIDFSSLKKEKNFKYPDIPINKDMRQAVDRILDNTTGNKKSKKR